MKHWLIMTSFVLACSAACADELGDAKKLFEQKQLVQAKQGYTKLAEAGVVEAQVLLAEMYWYGEGGPVDNAKAEHWFKQAAAKGDAKAQAALKVMEQRVARKSEIEFYTTRFDAKELDYAAAKCVRPMFPESSQTKSQIAEVDAAFKLWYDCHAAWVARLNQSLPPGKAIPADLANLMSDDDLALAQAHMGKVYADHAAKANVVAELVAADQANWKDATAKFIAKRDATIKAAEAKNASGTNAAARQRDMMARATAEREAAEKEAATTAPANKP